MEVAQPFDRVEYTKNYNAKYYAQNKDYWSKKFDCECGGTYVMSHKSRHFSSKKHKKMEDDKLKQALKHSEKLELLKQLVADL